VRSGTWAGEAQVRQFLDIGIGLPTADIPTRSPSGSPQTPGSCYVDNALVLTHSRALLTGTPRGHGLHRLRPMRPRQDPGGRRSDLGFHQPIALMLMGILGHIGDHDEARSILKRLLDPLPSGSYLALNDGTNVISQAFAQAQQALQRRWSAPYHLRSPEQIAGFFDGLELVEPGLVSVPRWRPDPTDASGDLPAEVDAFGGVGRNP
jgi:S-adenosyl methyltransferase